MCEQENRVVVAAQVVLDRLVPLPDRPEVILDLELGDLVVHPPADDRSFEELDRAYKIKPDAEVAFDFGLAYKALGPKQTARQWLEKSVELDPKRAETWFRLGEVYQDSNQPGDDRKMIAAFDKATRLGVEEEAKGAQLDWLTEAFYTLGDQYMLVHDLSGAKRAWQQYVDRHPKDQTRYKTAVDALATTLKSVP